MRWHEEGRKKDGMIRHPANARQWMHLEKNVFDNVIGTLLDIAKKTKDGLQV
jgi:hypothetical protein